MTDAATPLERLRAVKARLSIGAVVERDVPLSGSTSSSARRGKCPFHQGKSSSFSVAQADKGEGYAHCFGCQWSGDMVKFLQDLKGWSFLEALTDLEARCGLTQGAVTPAPDRGAVMRERNPATRPVRQKVLIETIDMARLIWQRARPDNAAVRRYFIGRGVPEWVLADARLAQFRFLGECPLMQWELKAPGDIKAWPRGTLNAPAVVAMVRNPVMLDSVTGPVLEFVPCGLHVTYLNPDGTGTMVRRKPWAKPDDDEPLFAKRKMLGPVGHGAVLLGEWTPLAPVYAGEGNETVFSGMALDDAPAGAVGLATLSLDNLQGHPLKWKSGIWPLHKIEPDPARPCFTVPGQQGPVTVLVDSDMAPLRGQKVVEAKGGPIIERAITGPERARICAELAVKGWRAVGAHQVRALRAPLGMDFNDAVQGVAA
jgi:DNA primase